MRQIIAAVLLLAAFVGTDALAASPRTITWDDLVPEGPPVDNPFTALSVEARDDLGAVARARLDLEYGYIEKGGAEHAEALELERKLAGQGLNVDELMAAAERLEAEFKRREHLVVQALDGQTVRMPGYALPLEFSETGVQEFLLVPYVGACIHVPPPPPNQTVFVELNQTYKLSSLYEAVWITGVMTIGGVSRELSFVDGQSEIPVGYTLKGVSIEPYR